MINAFNMAASRPWVMQAEALEGLLTIAQRANDPSALMTREGKPLENARKVTMRDGVAVIPVRGPIFRYANLFTEISGATATGVLATDIQTALDNPYVRGIVLEMDTPGGEVTGVNELSALIAEGRRRKRIVAYGGGLVASGGYWLASAASEIVIDETALLGSIGVVMSYLDTTARDERNGVKLIEIVSSQSPDKRVDPSTKSGREKVQALVDSLAEVFVNAVATNRNTTADKVISDFGRGGLLVGAAAVAAGMADRIGSLEAVIAELAGSASTTRTRPMNSNTSNGQVTVSTTADLRSALAAGHTPEQIVLAPAASGDAIDAARAEGVAEGQKAATDNAVKAERDRITKLQSMARAGFEAELTAAIETGQSPEAFAMALLSAASDRGITLDAIKRDSHAPAAHAKPGESQGGGTARRTTSDIYAARRQQSAGAAAK
jgi:signal peptide peptidase SppA